MILLTGATGYLGSQIGRQLAARGIRFRALVRDPSRAPAEIRGAPNCDLVVGDLRDRETLAKALRGAKQVIHTAALVKMWVRDRREFERVNVDGLKSLLSAAAANGV